METLAAVAATMTHRIRHVINTAEDKDKLVMISTLDKLVMISTSVTVTVGVVQLTENAILL